MSLEKRGMITGLVASAVSVGGVFGVAAMVHQMQGPNPKGPAGTVSPHTVTAVTLKQSQQGTGRAESSLVGKHLYLANCAVCHGANAEGSMGPNLHKSAKRPDTVLTAIIRNGKGAMPPFKSKLKDADIQAIISFVHTLKQ